MHGNLPPNTILAAHRIEEIPRQDQMTHAVNQLPVYNQQPQPQHPPIQQQQQQQPPPQQQQQQQQQQVTNGLNNTTIERPAIELIP